MSSHTDNGSTEASKMEGKEGGAASNTSNDNEKPQQEEGCGSNAENNVLSDDSIAPEPSTAGRVPFTSLSQVDSDMALARRLQEQERAYFLLQMGHGGGDYDDSDRFFYEGSHFDIPGDDEEYRDEEEQEEEEEDEEVEEAEEGTDDPEEPGIEGRSGGDEQLDGANFDSDEAYARALQDKEDRDTTAHLMALAGIHDPDGAFETDSNDSHDMWEDMDPDNMSYEELIALGEAVGTESKGLNAQSVAALQQFTYVPDAKDSSTDQEQCVVCRLEYEKGDKMLRLPCKHHYHSECIQLWLQHNKVCPVCSAEVTTESSSSDVTNSTN